MRGLASQTLTRSRSRVRPWRRRVAGPVEYRYAGNPTGAPRRFLGNLVHSTARPGGGRGARVRCGAVRFTAEFVGPPCTRLGR